MTEAVTKFPVKTETKSSAVAPARNWRPFESLRHEVDRLFDTFDTGFSRMPFGRALFDYSPFGRADLSFSAPAVDIAEKENEYEIAAELPGIDEKDIEIKLSNGGLVIKGEKKDEKEEKRKDYFLSERRYGAFERYFALPEGVDTGKISATFKKGVLTVNLPKTVEAKQQEKKIAIKAA